MSKRFLLILAALAVVFVGFVFFSNKDSSDTNASVSNHTVGAGEKGVTLLEYGDFQCPACGSYYPIVKQVKKKYGDDITFQFRNFPLVQIHRNAMVAHRAAEAASNQNKFWQMHDMLYERQQEWVESNNATAIMEQYAGELKLDLTKFKADFASQAVADTISADIKAGQAANATSTPTFLINGIKINPLPRDLAGFSQLIDDAAKTAAQQQ